MTEPFEVELYVCEACRERGIQTIGKIPQGRGSQAFRGMCSGPAAEPHKRCSMKLRRFRELVEVPA